MNTNQKHNSQWIKTNGWRELTNLRKLWMVLPSLLVTGLAAITLIQIGPWATAVWTMGLYVMGALADAKPNTNTEQEFAWALLYCGIGTGTLVTLVGLLGKIVM